MEKTIKTEITYEVVTVYVKERDTHGNPTEYYDDDMEFDCGYGNETEALDEAKSIARTATLDDDYFTFVREVAVTLEDGFPISDEEIVTIATIDFIKDVYEDVKKYDREAMRRTLDAIEGDSKAAKLAREVCSAVLGSDYDYYQVVTRIYFDADEVYSKAYSLDDSEGLAGDVEDLFKATANRLNLFPVNYGERYGR